MGIFSELKTDIDVEPLKKKIVRDPVLSKAIADVRSGALYTKGGTRRIDDKMMPSTAELLSLYEKLVHEGAEREDQAVRKLLRKMRTKSNSGVAVVSILTKPYACPGRCTYCPNDVRMPKSYLADEPAAARALLNDFDPYRQVTTRLMALSANGHPVDKIEMIIIGGTWSFYHPAYQEEFLIGAYRACNDWQTGHDSRSEAYEDRRAYIRSLEERNETATARVIGLSIETRPDYITDFEIERMRLLGVTKVEIGVQHLDDEVLRKTKRDMKIARVIEATERLRDAGFKLVYHMMPNLPGSTPERDIAMIGELFSGKDFHPDMLKIYPCVVLKTTELYDEFLRGEYQPYNDKELTNVLIGAKKQVPPYVRIQRVVRDIPAGHIEAGSKISNLREVIARDMEEHGWHCKCIRCREVREEEVHPEDYVLIERQHETQRGTEYFLSFEKDDTRGGRLASFTRLRIPKDFTIAPLPELVGAALIRELHTYGQHTRVGAQGDQSQHVGFGRRLIVRAEEIAKGAGANKLAIIAGVGVRKYYEKLGYHLEGTYMVKEL